MGPLAHDNRWHKPSCPYHTKLSDVSEAPKYRPDCPECQKMPAGKPCRFSPDDGYPESFLQHGRAKAGTVADPERAPMQKAEQDASEGAADFLRRMFGDMFRR